MSDIHDKLVSANRRRLILIAEDEEINRLLLENILQEHYDLAASADGLDTMEKLRQYGDRLSLVLLDLNMPGLDGLEILRRMREDPVLQKIPVIVLTAEQEAEVESLSLGAVDFIPKPYPQVKVILARIRRTIELSEDRQIISSTERDPLTGLLNREFFYRYAEQYDRYHSEDMDAIILDIYRFHVLNERFGRGYGDEVLRRIAEQLLEAVRELDGMVCRREADTFLIYCPHGADYRALLERASRGLEDGTGHVRLRMGIYEKADKSLEIERRYDRAVMAANRIRASYTKNIEVFDDHLREEELYNERLISDFPDAIAEKQFIVYYQPKFNIRPETPKLSSAEALIRWKHPELGMIPPGSFIPLFEENGLVQELDRYVWRAAAAQVRDWKDRFGVTLPVSVNVSRIDLYDPRLMETLTGLLTQNGLSPADLLLEITESAYTGDSDNVVTVINKLRDAGFRIEVDDFGSGYSSLNMITTLPIDVLKLDMAFIRSAFRDGVDTRMLKVMIDIARILHVPVVAEGVETEPQLRALREIGCDIVQGYYFSRPVPPEEFEAFLKS